jgi:hypothetical protein
MRSRRSALVLAVVVATCIPLVVLGHGEEQLVTVALIAALGALLHRTRPDRLKPGVR